MAKQPTIKSGERRTATLLFADLQGFTTMSEHMDPEEMDSLMGRVFELFSGLIQTHGGVVEKYIGDALVAVFGAPELHEDDPLRALESAMQFIETLHSQDTRETGIPVLHFRIGIHEGLVTTGTRGGFDVVTGHAMAVAQRLQSAADPDRILVSEAIKLQCEKEYIFSGPRLLEAKGKSEAISAWQVEGPAQANETGNAPFIGRREPLEELLRAYIKDDPATISGRYIHAEAGMGKSRLVQALIERIRSLPEFSSPILVSKAQKFRAAHYEILCDIILDYLDPATHSGPGLTKAILAALPEVDKDHAKRVAGLLALQEGQAPETDLLPALFSIFSAIMERHCKAIYAAVIVIDNAPLMDRQSREFIQYYLKHGRILPFLIMAGREHPPALRDAFSEIRPLRLGPLLQDEARTLALGFWPEAPDKLLELILAQSSGNPLFIREYCLFARKRRDLSELPASIQNLFLTSLERYEPELRDIIKKLSAFVHHFKLEDAARVVQATGGNPAMAGNAITRFVQDGILVAKGGYFNFARDVFRKAVYAGLLNHNKKIIHSVIADIMQDREKPGRFRLIHHLILSERWKEAAQVMRLDPARNYTYEYLDHINLLYRKLSPIDPDLAVQLLILKSALYFNAGRIDEADQELKRIMRIALAQRNDNAMGFAYHMISVHNSMAYSLQKALFTGQKALYYYRNAGMSPRSIQNVVRTIAFAQMQRNSFEEAHSLVEQMRSIPEYDNFEYACAKAEYKLYSGNYQEALAAVDGALASVEDDYHAVTRFFGLDLKLKALWQLCDFEALGTVAKALTGTRSLSEAAISQAHAMLAASCSRLGDAKLAEESFLQAEYYCEQVGNDFDRIEALKTLALCHLVTGDGKKAEAFARKGCIVGLRHSSYYPTLTLLMILVQLSFTHGQLDEARFFLREASYLFTTGLLLPHKDTLLYYYYAGKLLSGEAAHRCTDLARQLLKDEIARLGDPSLVANFLSVRDFGSIQAELYKLGGETV
ncbi:MAG: adenylate/guanylate cyclase domain-containing protein [Clostridia bacterium]